MRPHGFLGTILFTDIVGSTQRASELGDHAWRELLAEHHALVRRELRRFGGHEANTAGDGFLATFDRPPKAIRCAWAIRESIRELGLEIRSGIHTGEIEGRGRDVGGIAVHIAARVSAEAGPGEILVSSTVRELMTGAGFRFEDRGGRALKGVPEEWRLYALESLPAGPAFRTGRWIPELTRRQTAMAAGVAVLVLAVLAAVILGGRTALERLSPGTAMAEGAAPGIAVLPFTVNDPDLAEWREGMVDLLATNLDGVGGLRAIDNRTILARWQEAVSGDERADLETALGVARRTGARYALAGDVVSIGAGMRLTADLYDLENGEKLGHAQVEGSLDSLFVLVDRLSIDLLGAVLEKGGGDLPRVSLARVTTSSVPALRAFLEGEARYRRSDWEPAISAYKRAIEADSTFALAHHRLSQAYSWWSETSITELAAQEAEIARRFADRLPERERMLVQVDALSIKGSFESVPLARELIERYPDDVEAWYLLGEVYYHVGPLMLIDIQESDRAFARAIALDPQFSPAYNHPIDSAFHFRADSARAAELVGRFRRIAPGTENDIVGRLLVDFAFGTPANRERARAALDTLKVSCFRCKVPRSLNHPLLLESQEIALEALLARDLDDAERARGMAALFESRVNRGKIGSALPLLEGLPNETRAPAAYVAYVTGMPIPEEWLDRILRPVPEADVGFADFYIGAYAADRGRWSDHQQETQRLRTHGSQLQAEGDSAGARLFGGMAEALEGYARWKRGGSTAQARPMLESARRRATGLGTRLGTLPFVQLWWLAEIALEEGRPEDAELLLTPFLQHSVGAFRTPALLRVGHVYEELERWNEAREVYQTYLVACEDAEPELAPQIAEVRQAVARLGMAPRG